MANGRHPRGRGSVRARIALGMLLSAALVIPVVVLSLFYVGQLNKAVQRVVTVDIELMRIADRLPHVVAATLRSAREAQPVPESAGAGGVNPALRVLDSLCLTGARLNPSLADRFATIRLHADEITRLAADSAQAEAVTRLQQQVEAEADTIIETALHSALRDRALAGRLSGWGQRNIVSVLVLVVVLLAVLVAVLPGRVVLPVKRIANALARAERGETDLHIAVRGDDELTQLGRQLNRVFARLRELDERKVNRIISLERRFKLLTADIAEGVLIFDRGPNVTFANAAAEPLLGAPPAEAVGKPLESFPHLVFLREQLEHTLSGAAGHQECGILPGLPFSAVCIEALRDNTGSVLGALVIVTNPTAPEPPSADPAEA
jgi:PAS domain-containing protein